MKGESCSKTPPPNDGRTARSDRTRESIVEAHLSLIREGDLKPTGERIAERAGISLRTLWVSFKDLEALFDASGAVVLAQEQLAFHPVDTGLPLSARIDEFCTQRAALLEMIAPQARAAKIRSPFSQTLRRNLGRHVNLVRAEIASTFGAELSTMPTQRSADTEVSVLAATTWATWSFLRDDLGHSPPHATSVMKCTVSALLTQSDTPAFSTLPIAESSTSPIPTSPTEKGVST